MDFRNAAKLEYYLFITIHTFYKLQKVDLKFFTKSFIYIASI